MRKKVIKNIQNSLDILESQNALIEKTVANKMILIAEYRKEIAKQEEMINDLMEGKEKNEKAINGLVSIIRLV